METPSPPESDVRPPHPLAPELANRLRSRAGARVLELGRGAGRNTASLAGAGLNVFSVADDAVAEFAASPGSFDAALSTHALLHGTPGTLASVLSAVANALRSQAPLYATFGSTADARYGAGTQIDEATFAPDSGDERGVAHAFFTEPRLKALLAPHFAIESLQQINVDDVVGSWAHREPGRGTVHWFVRALRRDR